MFFETCSRKKIMNSVNKEQPEKNHENLSGKEAVKKLREISEKASTCFLCTNLQAGKPFAARPMAVQKLDEQGTFWFLSANDSHQNEHIQQTPYVQLLFQGASYSDFLSVFGHATISKEKNKIKELWNPMLKTWFTEGENDPRITVIHVRPEHAYYWDVKHNQAVAFLKQVAGAIMGTTLDDSIEGNIRV
jgi:general stress protein 26